MATDDVFNKNKKKHRLTSHSLCFERMGRRPVFLFHCVGKSAHVPGFYFKSFISVIWVGAFGGVPPLFMEALGHFQRKSFVMCSEGN